MKYWNRTLSYLKRNGPAATLWAVAERKDASGIDQWQRRTMRYDHDTSEKALIGKRRRLPESLTKGYEKKSFTAPVATSEREPVCISLLVPAYETKTEYFKQMVESVLGQKYLNWQLVIADASATPRLEKVIRTYDDPRITYVRLTMNDGISDNTNALLPYVYGDYVGFLDHDDLLAEDAIAEMAGCIADTGCEIVYSDEDKVTGDLKKGFEANFKPAFNLDLLLTNNYICHLTIMRKELFEKLQLRHEYDGAQDYDLLLRAVLGIEWERVEKLEEDGKGAGSPEYGRFPADYFKDRIRHVPRILYHWRAHETSTSDNPDSKRYAYEAGKRALEDFYAQLDWDTEVSHTRHLGFYRTEYYPDILTVRQDIWGLCGRKVKHGRVVEGPVLGGVRLFEGMNYHYSGYLHRAALPFDVDKAPAGLIRVREDCEKITDEMRRSGRLLYQPDLKFKG